MAKNYNPKSDSSDFRNSRTPQSRKSSAGARRDSSDRPQPVANRRKIDYTQSAKNDLAAQTPQNDPRMRYTRFRTDKATRVLGDPEEARSEERHQMRAAPGGVSSLNSRGETDARRQGAHGRGEPNMTVREYRERRRGIARRKSKAPQRILLAVAILLVLGIVAFAVYQSPLFTVRDVRVEGAQRLTDERLTELAAIPQGSTLLRLDIEGVQSRLENDPWVESAEIRRAFPSALILTVKERVTAAVVEVPSLSNGAPGQTWLLSRDGVWLGSFDANAASGTDASTSTDTSTDETPPADADNSADADSSADADVDAEPPADADADAASGTDDSASADASTDETPPADADASAGTDSSTDAESAADATSNADSNVDSGAGTEPSVFAGVQMNASELAALPSVRDVSRSIAPQIGASVEDEGVLNALAIVTAFTPDMLSRIRSISAPDRVKTMITLTNNVEVAFGAAEDVAAKEQVILSLLSEHEGTLTYINVRVADRATYRATQ
jgi:cell division septal protein FtsQ